jgi:hypothetical protein
MNSNKLRPIRKLEPWTKFPRKHFFIFFYFSILRGCVHNSGILTDNIAPSTLRSHQQTLALAEFDSLLLSHELRERRSDPIYNNTLPILGLTFLMSAANQQTAIEVR